MSRSLLVVLCALALGPASEGLAAETVDFEQGTYLAEGMQDIRTRTLTSAKDADVFGFTIASKGTTIARYFNGKTPYPTMSYPNPPADLDPAVLTKTEIEAGLDQWWSNQTGTPPDDAARAEFDEVVGKVLRSRIYTLANPVAARMLEDGYSPDQIRRALVYQPAAGDTLNYRGLVFGAAAVEGGMSRSRAALNIERALGCSSSRAIEYLTRDYGRAEWTFYVQAKAPLDPGQVSQVRGARNSSLYRRIEASVERFQPAQGFALAAGLHPGTQSPVEFPEPFDPGALDSQDTTLLANTNMEVWAEYRPPNPGGGPPPRTLLARGHHYVENYRKVTDAELAFTGALGGQTVDNSRQVASGVRSPVVLPYNDGDGGSAKLELPDGAQVNAAFKAIVELGDGVNGYVRYRTVIHGNPVETILYWVPAARIPGGMTTRWGTTWRGPGIGPTSGEEPSILEELVQNESGLHWINPPESMRAWLDPLLFDMATGMPNRPQVANALIKEAWEAAGSGGKPFGEYSPFAVCNTANGHIMKIPLDFDLATTGDPQQTGIFRAGDVVLAQNFTQNAPTSFLYRSIQSDLIPPDKLPTDISGRKIKPNGENLYLEASTCCGITSIIGGSTVTKSDKTRPNAQITAVESAEDEATAGGFSRKVAVTAGVPDDPRAALDPVGEYQLLYPLSRIHKDLPVLPEGTGDVLTGVQGQDAKFYGDYSNDSPVFAHAPDHPEYRADPRSLANPVDSLDVPFMNLHGASDRADPMYQDFRQGHRYTMTLAAWDNLPPLVIEPIPQSGIAGHVCYEVRRFDYRVYRLDPGGVRTTQFEGKVIPDAERGNQCIQTAPSVEIPWVPHADGPYVWELDVEDLEGNTRRVVSQVNVSPEKIDARQLDYEQGRRGD